MIEILSLGILAIFTMYYIYFITRVRMGLLSLRTAAPTPVQPMVSVIVAARDEEPVIGQCLQSLVQQTYPAALYKIVMVDDGSTDRTASIGPGLFKTLSPCPSSFVSRCRWNEETGRKPLALDVQASNIAAGEIILTTDADCIASPGWIECMVRHCTDDVAFIAGPVAIQNSHRFLQKLEQLEFLGLITTSSRIDRLGKTHYL